MMKIQTTNLRRSVDRKKYIYILKMANLQENPDADFRNHLDTSDESRKRYREAFALCDVIQAIRRHECDADHLVQTAHRCSKVVLRQLWRTALLPLQPELPWSTYDVDEEFAWHIIHEFLRDLFRNVCSGNGTLYVEFIERLTLCEEHHWSNHRNDDEDESDDENKSQVHDDDEDD